MRWADSDSDSEEEYKPPSQQERSQDPSKTAPVVLDDRPATAPLPPPSPPDRGGRGGGRGRGGGKNHHNSYNDDRGGGGRFGGRGRGGGSHRDGSHDDRGRGRGGGRQQPQKDWKQMAKESSRFSGAASAAATKAPVDGGAWMAQRRAKMEQEEKDRKKQEKLHRQKLEEEKRERRKEQLSALKAAVVQIKEPPPSPPKTATSLQRAAILGEPLPSTPTFSDKKPPAILSRDKSQGSPKGKAREAVHRPPMKVEEGQWPRAAKKNNQIAKSAEKEMYSLTISGPPKPSLKGELQPDGSVKFSKGGSFTHKKGQREGDHRARYTSIKTDGGDGADGTTAKEEEHSISSVGSKNKMRRNNNKRGSGRDGRGRGERTLSKDIPSADGEDVSVGSNASFGPGRGQGRGRGNSGRGGRGGRRRQGRGRGRGRSSPGRGRGRDSSSEGPKPKATNNFEIGKSA